MSFKFAVGQAVEYKPTGGTLGRYAVIRQMPEEFRAFDRKYRIKSEQEGFERTVLECDLHEAGPESHYAKVLPMRRQGGR